MGRQFTIPKGIRLLLGIRPLDEVEVVQIRPLSDGEVGGEEFRVVSDG